MQNLDSVTAHEAAPSSNFAKARISDAPEALRLIGEGGSVALSRAAKEIAYYIGANLQGAFDMSTDADGYDISKAAFAGFPNIFSFAGLHPWVVSRRAKQDVEGAVHMADIATDAALCKMAASRLIGEVGLDFSPGVLGDAADVVKVAQTRAFSKVLDFAAASDAPVVVSLHCVHAAADMFELLAPVIAARTSSVFILHRFGGTSDELVRFARAGAWFSVGAQTLATKRGRAYVRQMPPNRLLLETDLPAREGDALTPARYGQALTGALFSLKDILGPSFVAQLENNEQVILDQILQASR